MLSDIEKFLKPDSNVKTVLFIDKSDIVYLSKQDAVPQFDRIVKRFRRGELKNYYQKPNWYSVEEVSARHDDRYESSRERYRVDINHFTL